MKSDTIKSYGKPKNYSARTKELSKLHTNEVELQEKIDGSQISWFKTEEGTLIVRSKGSHLSQISCPDQFRPAYTHLESVKDKIIPGIIFRGEALKTQRHNHLNYERTPKGHIVLYDAEVFGEDKYLSHADLEANAKAMDIDVTQHLGKLKPGEVFSEEMFKSIYSSVISVLGGKIEGVVLKNYSERDADGKLLMAKWVADEFREVERKGQKHERSTQVPPVVELSERYRTEARWRKAIQHLKDEDKLENSTKDIGKLVEELKRDILEEETNNIKNELFDIYIKDILKRAVDGFAQFYKAELRKENDENENGESPSET